MQPMDKFTRSNETNGAHMTTLKTLIRDYLAKRACREMWKE
jgi:hypothetical protein